LAAGVAGCAAGLDALDGGGTGAEGTAGADVEGTDNFVPGAEGWPGPAGCPDGEAGGVRFAAGAEAGLGAPLDPVPGFPPVAGAGMGAPPGAMAAEGSVAEPGAVPGGLPLPGAGVAAEGSGRPCIPGSGAPGNGLPVGAEVGDPALPAPGVWVCRAALCATDGGSDGPIAATGCAPAPAPPWAGAAACAGGWMVLVWPAWLVTVTVLVTLFTTTVLCTLL
jgi:hypothetical protein